jgi:hypothetical protein
MAEQEKPQLPSGVLISGICMGAETTVDGNYTNHNLYIKVGERQNEVQETQSIIETVSLFGDSLNALMERANALKGKHVVIPVYRAPARRDLRDAYMRNSLTRNSQILALN